MISLKSRTTLDAKTTGFEGVKFTIRTLNKIQRAARDLPIAQHSVEYWRMVADANALLPKNYQDLRNAAIKVTGLQQDKENGLPVEDSILAMASKEFERLNAEDAPETRHSREALNYRANLIFDQYIKPATIRAGLISLEGLEIEGKPATPELLLTATSDACDGLIDEIYAACDKASGLSGETQKNSESPTTSSVGAETNGKSSTAATAN